MKKNSFLSLLLSRQLWAFIALLVLALVIWFVGPFLAIAGLKPLSGVGTRVLLIVLLLVGLLFWMLEWSTSIVLLGLICLLIWYAAPFLSIGQHSPFAPESIRWIAITVVIGGYLVYWLFRLWQRMRDDEQFLRKLLQFGRHREENPAAARMQRVAWITDNAMGQLRHMRTGVNKWVRAFHSKRYLYELPWYVTLGANHSGKTSVLLKAGFSFPIAAQLHRTAYGQAEQAQPLDWWLTNETVLIDTAGYYTSHGTSGQRLIPSGGSSLLPLIADTQQTGMSAAPFKHDEDEDDSEPSADPVLEASGIHPGHESNKGSAVSRASEVIDRAEWFGFLSLLRKLRPRAPVNGAVLTIDLQMLVGDDAATRVVHIAQLRARLAELREQLGVRFPIYLVITKMDQLPGFMEYFESLTTEGRSQVWGFTLPYRTEKVPFEHLRERCHDELKLLGARLSDAVNTRLQDEFETSRRVRLVALPEEFAALVLPTVNLIAQLFLDSRYDDTQLRPMLRGVYFTSSNQGDHEIAAGKQSIFQRLTNIQPGAMAAKPRAKGTLSYFLSELFANVVLNEAHLVRPNLRWEYRLRLVRFLGHALILILSLWLLYGIDRSFHHNSEYLRSVESKTVALEQRVAQQYRSQNSGTVPDTLNEVLAVPTHVGLNLAERGRAWGFGLYTPPAIEQESRKIYDALQDSLLIPHIVRRLEAVIANGISTKDTKLVYDTLRVYLMLHEKDQFDADSVKTWVLRDWAETDSAADFGGRASMIEHLQKLFSGQRIVQSPLMRNESLIQKARSFLDSSNATERLYERAKAAMQNNAPDEFTLIQALGPTAATIFTRASGQPMTRGVPGLFTRDGYRNVFDKELADFVNLARSDDARVMGRSYLGDGEKKTLNGAVPGTLREDPLTEAIRREFLNEYRQLWEDFLGDVRLVSGGGLASDVQVLRLFAAPDSPLSRLARAATRETTLAMTLAPVETTFLQKAADQINQKADKFLGARASEKVERELVDNRFAALREIVTGSADAPESASGASPLQGKSGLDAVGVLLSEFHLSLTLAENALVNNSMPPVTDTAVRLKMMAQTMPAPLQEVLLQLSGQGSREINHGIGLLLSRQMQAVIGDACRLVVDGNFPFSQDSQRAASIDDFTRVFAQSGVIDDFFVKNLAPLVDTSAKPWRYRTLAGATEPIQGPDLAPFERAKDIREIFFTDAEHKQLTWKAELRVPEMDPTIASLLIDIDGQNHVYQHGPVQPFSIAWPGPRGGVHAEITANPRIRPDTSTLSADGPWALMRLIQKGKVVGTATPGRSRVSFEIDGRSLALEVNSPGTLPNPLTSNVLSAFRCPAAMSSFGNQLSDLPVNESRLERVTAGGGA